MNEQDVGLVVVTDHRERVIGVVTDRDLATRAMARELPYATPVREIMTPAPLACCGPEDDLRWVEEVMAHARKARILVLSPSQHCLGVIGLAEIARADPPRARRILDAVVGQRTPWRRHSDPWSPTWPG
jgi:CBS domain-containing protein